MFFRKFGEIFKTFVSSLVVVAGVADPDPSDPYVFFFFCPPGSGSISQGYGSGSFYYKTKIIRKTLIPIAL